MNKDQLNNATATRSVDQQQACSALPRSEWHIDFRRRLCHPAWNNKEIAAIEKLAEMKDMDTSAVVRQALRQYHAVAHGACSITWPNK